MRTFLRGKTTLLFIMVAVLVAVPAVAALADTVANNVDNTIDTDLETLTLTEGGANGTPKIYVAPANLDGINGCNLKNDGEITVNVASNNTSVATVGSPTATIADCGEDKGATVAVTPVGPGTTTISVTGPSTIVNGTDTGSFTYRADFTVRVKQATSITQVSGTGTSGSPGNASLSAKLSSSLGDDMSGKTVSFAVNPTAGVCDNNTADLTLPNCPTATAQTVQTANGYVATANNVSLPSTFTAANSPYTFTASYAGDATNYGASSGSGNLVVTPPCTAPAITTSGHPSNQSITYGANATFTAAASGNPTPSVQWEVNNGSGWTALTGEESNTLTLTKPSVSMSGNQYRAVFSNECGGTKSAATNAATLTVAQRAITVTADAQSKTYGNADPTLTYQLDNSTPLAPNETLSGILSGSLTRASGETVANSPYAIQQGTLVANSNYNMTFVGANLTINPRPITVVPNANQSKIYGNTDPTLTYSLASGSTYGFSDTASTVFTGSLTRASGETVANSPYAIQQGTLAANSNYALTFSSTVVNFTINPRPITVTADNKTKILGAATDPALTYQLDNSTPLAPNETLSGVLSGSLTRDSGESIGSYPIRQGTLAANSNYSLSFVNGTLKIVYNVSVTSGAGFQQPINNTAHFLTTYGTTSESNSVFKAGSTVPVKFVLKDAQGNIVQSNSAPKWVTPKQGSPFSGLNVNEEATFLTSTTDGTFDWDGTQYQYNWSTKNFAPNYFWRIGISLDDGTFHYVSIGLRK